MSAVRKLVAGNWKMHGLSAQLAEAEAIAHSLAKTPAAARVAICPPAVLIHRMAERLAGTSVLVGAQDIHAHERGAHTGDQSGEMLHDAGATMVIIGHSERRAAYAEPCAQVAAKARAALKAGLEPILCLGETREERDAGAAIEVVTRQLRDSLPDALEGQAFAVAYEPVWAIGSGATPTLAEIEEVHRALRQGLVSRFSKGAVIPILYGGSVKPANAKELLGLPNVDGALVGGASLKAQEFLALAAALS